jgi:flagellar assembly protein FliH
VWHSFEEKAYAPAFLERVKEAEKKALKQSKDKALLIEKEAYEKGFAQGEKSGVELGQKRLEAVIDQLKKLVKEIGRQRERLHKTFEKEMLDLVLSVARKVVHREVEQNQEVILSTLRESLRSLVDQRKVIVHLNPVDYQHILTPSESSQAILDETEGLKLIKDPSIARGGCYLETSFGDIDATIESQFERIVSSVWERFEQAGEPSHPETP